MPGAAKGRDEDDHTTGDHMDSHSRGRNRSSCRNRTHQKGHRIHMDSHNHTEEGQERGLVVAKSPIANRTASTANSH